jgi:hypothetical protein
MFKQIAVQVFHRYFTGDALEVTERIQDGRTELFSGKETKFLVDKRARVLRSYSYPVYTQVKNKGLVFAGYGVPR